MILFSGTSNLPLTEKIAKKIGIRLGDAEIKRFLDLECRVWVKENLKSKDVFVLQSLSIVADQNLMELCLLGSAIKHLGARSITAIIPWMGYCKQDREFRKGEAVSSELVAKFLQTASFTKIITLELHSEKIKEYFSIPIIELSTKEILAKETKMSKSLTVVSPDKGGRGRSETFAKYLGLGIAHLDKERDLVTGKVNILGIDKDIKNKEAVIFDDMINTGSTAIETAKYLKNKGAKKILFLATHPIFCGEAYSRLQNSVIDKVVVTDTIFVPKEKLFKKLKIVSVAELVAKAIRNF